jgi:hypothetical protein
LDAYAKREGVDLTGDLERAYQGVSALQSWRTCLICRGFDTYTRVNIPNVFDLLSTAWARLAESFSKLLYFGAEAGPETPRAWIKKILLTLVSASAFGVLLYFTLS